jgi:hypothetical protein
MELPRYRSQTLPQVAAESPFSAAVGAGASSRALASGFDVISDITNRIATAEAEATAAAGLTDLQVKTREFVSNEKWKQPEIDGRPTDEVLKEEWSAFSQTLEPPRIGNRNAQNQYDNARKRILSDASLTVDSLKDRILIDRTRASESKAADDLLSLGNYNGSTQVIKNSIAFGEQEKQQLIQRGAAIATDTFVADDPYKALEELNKTAGDSEQPFINDLDPNARNVAINRAEAGIRQIESERRAQEAARQAQINSMVGYASDWLTSYTEAIGVGVKPPPEGAAQVASILGAMEDGPRKAQLQSRFAALNAIQSSGFLELPPLKQRDATTAKIAAMQTGPYGSADVTLASLMKEVSDRRMQAAKDDPALLAERDGIIQSVNIPVPGESVIGNMADAAANTGWMPLDPNVNAPSNTFASTLNRASRNADIVSAYLGFNAPGLTNEQISSLEREYKAGDVNQRLGIISAVVQTHGPAKAVDLFTHINKTMGPDMAAAGVLSLEDPVAAQFVLRGQKIREDGGKAGKSLAPPSIDFPTEINARLNNAYDPGSPTRDIIESAVRDAYMALAADAGVLANQSINANLMDKAVQLVTGGIVYHNGAYTPVPVRGVTQAGFDGFVADINENDFASISGMEPAYALEAFRRDGRLVQRQKGLFEVQIPHPSGDGYITAKGNDGNELMIPWREAGFNYAPTIKSEKLRGFRY